MMDEEADNDARTIFVGRLTQKVTEEILYELFLQAGPLERVKIPMTNGRAANYAFVTYQHVCSVDYALEIYKDTELFGNPLTLKKRKAKQQENYGQDMNRNGNMNYNAVLQAQNNMVHMSNMYHMEQDYYQNNSYYMNIPQGKRSPPRNRNYSTHRNNTQTPSGRYDRDRDNRSHRRYDEYKSSHNDRHNRKRHKR